MRNQIVYINSPKIDARLLTFQPVFDVIVGDFSSVSTFKRHDTSPNALAFVRKLSIKPRTLD